MRDPILCCAHCGAPPSNGKLGGRNGYCWTCANRIARHGSPAERNANFLADLNDEWRNSAACLAEDPELFFPPAGFSGFAAVREAKRICSTCPVEQDCLADSIRTGELHGIRGGLSEEERKALRKAAGVRA